MIKQIFFFIPVVIMIYNNINLTYDIHMPTKYFPIHIQYLPWQNSKYVTNAHIRYNCINSKLNNESVTLIKYLIIIL